ncbi:MAG: hypothetical protein NTZ43_02585 [Gemmatimonadetes bacterium]|nr:hypothetical protein [Gemmatimonadota bacterium]
MFIPHAVISPSRSRPWSRRPWSLSGGHEAAVAEAAEHFGRVEAEGARSAEGAGEFAFEAGAERLRGVFDNSEIVLFGDGANGVHVAGAAVHLHGHDELGALGDGRFNGRGVHHVIGADVHCDGDAAREVHGGWRCDHSVRRENDFVSWLNASGAQRDVEAVGGIAHPKRVFDAEVFGAGGFEVTQIFLHDERATREHIVERAGEFLLNGGEGAAVVEERDFASGGHGSA